ncbi:MAG TPA: transglutaminase [Planctomycetaceae bacterium]|nr:transglutaminase [Planctomycetaceae bacterium]
MSFRSKWQVLQPASLCDLTKRPVTHRRDVLRYAASLCGISALATTTTLLADDRRAAVPGKSGDGNSNLPNDEAAATTDAAWRLSYDSPQKQTWRIGLRLDTNGVACNNILATFPIPMSWPEQAVRVVGQEIDDRVDRWSVRDLPGGARQVVLTMPRVLAGATPEVMLELEVIRSRIVGPESTSDLMIPVSPDSKLKIFLGTSPYIDSTDSRIRNAARDIAEQGHADPWSHVEAIYDWVREKVKYVEGDIKSASQALRDGEGDCEELTSLFIAVCRASKIPARMVWIPDHCYPEFYLEDAKESGTWFPCQAAGTRQFGSMDEYRPVLQKGDRFKVPEKRQTVRYVAEFFQCVPVGKRQPRPVFVREVLEG